MVLLSIPVIHHILTLHLKAVNVHATVKNSSTNLQNTITQTQHISIDSALSLDL